MYWIYLSLLSALSLSVGLNELLVCADADTGDTENAWEQQDVCTANICYVTLDI